MRCIDCRGVDWSKAQKGCDEVLGRCGPTFRARTHRGRLLSSTRLAGYSTSVPVDASHRDTCHHCALTPHDTSRTCAGDAYIKAGLALEVEPLTLEKLHVLCIVLSRHSAVRIV